TTKKRNRISRVCGFCKRRKIKCDRGSPCLSCVKYGNRNCHYAEIELVAEGEIEKNGELESTLESLKKKLRSLEEYVGKANVAGITDEIVTGRLNLAWSHTNESTLKVSPVASEKDYINFFEGYTSVNVSEPIRRRNFGPLSWYALIKVDGALGILWEYVYAKHESYHERVRNMFHSGQDATDPDTKAFANKVNDDEGFNDVREISYINACGQQSFNILDSTEGIKQRHIFSAPASNRNEELELITKIKLALPSRKVIWLLYKRFFINCYLFMPCIDEVVLKEQLSKIIGEESLLEEPVADVQVSRRLDFAHLGALLLVLRFSYLTLFNNLNGSHDPRLSTDDPSPKVQELKYLLSNPIGLEIVEVAHECLNQFNLMRGINMSIMQLALLTRFYHMYAPEDGDGVDGGDAQVFNAMLIQMAYALGLHRDPDNFPDQCVDEKSNNLARKMWYCVIIIDLNNTMTAGTPMNVNINSFDTKVPFYKPGNENVVNVALEKHTVKAFKMLEASFERLADIMLKIMDVKGSVSIRDLEVKLEFMRDHYATFASEAFEEGVRNPHNLLTQLLRTKVFLNSSLFVVSVYLHVFNYYERRRDIKLAYNFLKRMMEICIGQVLPFYFEFYGLVDQFADVTDLIVAPSFEQACHKSVIVLTAIFIRVKIITMNFETSYDHSTKMNENSGYKSRYKKWVTLTESIEKSMRLFREFMAILSPRFYYAWRITKAQRIMCSLLTDQELFDRTRTSPKLVNLPLDNGMLDDLNEIFDKTFSRISQLKKEKGIKLNPNVGTPNFFPPSTNDSRSYNSVGSVPSTASSDSHGDVNLVPNDEIDRIWMLMLSLKKSNDNGATGYYNN
ncbi:uncharacterized protein CANTADRAFT_28377, partial [Suhomyces tanzawaensis NRRL Y-17324]